MPHRWSPEPHIQDLKGPIKGNLKHFSLNPSCPIDGYLKLLLIQ